MSQASVICRFGANLLFGWCFSPVSNFQSTHAPNIMSGRVSYKKSALGRALYLLDRDGGGTYWFLCSLWTDFQWGTNRGSSAPLISIRTYPKTSPQTWLRLTYTQMHVLGKSSSLFQSRCYIRQTLWNDCSSYISILYIRVLFPG